MSAAHENGSARRVLAAVFAEADMALAARHAVRLAQILESAVAGILVEEAELFDLAGLALASEIGRTSLITRPLDSARLAVETERALMRLRRAFREAGEPPRRPLSIESVRARAAEPLRAAGFNDLVLFAGSVERLGEPEFASALLDAAGRAIGLAICADRGHAPTGPVVAVLDSIEAAERLRPLLARMTAAEGSRLELAVAATWAAGPEELAETLARLPAGTVVRQLDPLPLRHAAANLAARRRARLLIGGTGLTAGADVNELRGLARHAGCPILLLNPGRL